MRRKPPSLNPWRKEEIFLKNYSHTEEQTSHIMSALEQKADSLVSRIDELLQNEDFLPKTVEEQDVSETLETLETMELEDKDLKGHKDPIDLQEPEKK